MQEMNGLNPRQWEAVTAPAGPALVLAGAGSGKTRVLTSRIAHLLEGGVRPGEILAVTFTNKAAREMRERLGRMVSLDLRPLWMGTFHGVAHRLLRLHHGALDLPEGFQVLDAEDSLRLIRRVMREAQLDEKQWPPRAMAARISRWKDEGWGPEQVRTREGRGAVIYAQVYGAYESAKARSGLVDFGDLLLYALRLWQAPEILAQYQRRIRHVLVDEFQDTNAVQYAWLKALAQHQNLFVVGDDDQAIYAWRGARVENLLRFGEDFPATRVVRLEQNYRSTGAILQAANAVIAHNPDRLGKTLWTEHGAGEAVQVYTAYNEVDEARYVVGRVQQWLAAGGRRAECAILYRSNAQSRAFEEALVREGVPYRVYGGLRFFERAEVKDALAYLRLLANRHDDTAFERVVNVPARGIGAVTLDRLRAAARAQGLSLWQAAGALGQGKVNEFLNLVNRLDRELAVATLAGKMEGVIVGSELRTWHAREGERAEGRLENLDELVTAARSYEQQWSAEGPGSDLAAQPGNLLSEFLTHAALEAGEGAGDAWEDCVQLMSLHSAKGLEFPLVFLTGLEEGLFPHQRALEDAQGLSEERRLCYVGMTRAMRVLVLSHAESRRLHGSERQAIPSRFLREVPSELLQDLRPRAKISRPAAPGRTVGADIPYPLGCRIQHPVFGEGVVLDYEADGRQGRIQVRFPSGVKWLALGIAPLERLA